MPIPVQFLFSWTVEIKMAERNDSFWIENEFKLREFERGWLDEVKKSDEEIKKDESKKCEKEKDYSMSGELDQRVERNIGNRVVLIGPMVDSYLKNLAEGMNRKLGRGNLTGLAPPISMFVPWQVMRFIASMATSYGARMHIVNKDKTRRKCHEKMIIWLEENCSDKLFNPSRFDGRNFLAKRSFKKLLNEETNKRELVYAGEARVVVSKYTPIQMDYFHKDDSLRINFYIQRYTKDGFVVDSSLQKLMNTDVEANENIFNEFSDEE